MSVVWPRQRPRPRPISAFLPLPSQGRTWPYRVKLSEDCRYPECPVHGAMNCVSPNLKLWRCLACEIGVEVKRTDIEDAVVVDDFVWPMANRVEAAAFSRTSWLALNFEDLQ